MRVAVPTYTTVVAGFVADLRDTPLARVTHALAQRRNASVHACTLWLSKIDVNWTCEWCWFHVSGTFVTQSSSFLDAVPSAVVCRFSAQPINQFAARFRDGVWFLLVIAL